MSVLHANCRRELACFMSARGSKPASIAAVALLVIVEAIRRLEVEGRLVVCDDNPFGGARPANILSIENPKPEVRDA